MQRPNLAVSQRFGLLSNRQCGRLIVICHLTPGYKSGGQSMVLSGHDDFQVIEAAAVDSSPSSAPFVDTVEVAISTDIAESLKIRTDLMLCLQQHIDRQQWSLQETCRILRQPSPRMQNLLNGEIGRFSIEDLIDLLSQVGLTVQFSVFSTRPLNSHKLVRNGPDETPLYH